MIEYEEDWQRLGQRLRNYEPDGQPEVDFAALQQLRREEDRRPSRRKILWLGLSLVLLVGSVAWRSVGRLSSTPPSAALITPVGSEDSAEHDRSPVKENLLLPASPSELTPDSSPDPAKVVPGAPPRTVWATRVAERPGMDNTQRLPDQALEKVEAGRKATTSAGRTTGAVVVSTLPSLPSVTSLNYEVRSLPEPTYAQATIPAEESGSPTFTRASRTTIAVNTGLSSHWRGRHPLEDTDQGLYFSLGAMRNFGRFGLDGRVGYRGHGVKFPALEGEATPWSHYEDKVNLFNDEGEEVEYTYVGIVDGYRGIEFSLLLHYWVAPQFSVQAGGRYSLPSLGFRRTVHSSHDGDVTRQPNPYHFFTTNTTLVRYRDYGLLSGAQWRLGNALSVEAMLHLGLVDLIEDAGERQARFNHSSSLSLGVQYRLR